MWIDILWALLAVYGIWKGWTNGLILSVFTAIAWEPILGAVKLSGTVAVMLHEKYDLQSSYLPVFSFIGVFLVIALIIFLVGKSLEKIVEVAQIGFVNRLAGMVLYVAVYTVVLSIFIWLLDEVMLISPGVKEQSKTYVPISRLADFMINNVSSYVPVVKQLFEDFQEFLVKMTKS